MIYYFNLIGACPYFPQSQYSRPGPLDIEDYGGLEFAVDFFYF